MFSDSTGPSPSRGEHALLALVFIVWMCVVVAAAATHEPWWDEAQAWLIARDAPVLELFTHVIRYEGHPPLWHLILSIPAKLGLPYWWLNVIGVLFGTMTTLLVLYAFPRVPIYIRVLVPFAFFIGYQYTVVSRSYVPLGPLLLLLARTCGTHSQRPLRFAVLLILLSHVSVHGFAIACSLALLFGIAMLTRRVSAPPRKAFVVAAAIFVVNSVLLVVALWPPAVPPPSYMHVHWPFSADRHAQMISSIVPALFWGPTSDETPAEALAMAGAALLCLGVIVLWLFGRKVGALYTLPTLVTYAIALRYFSMWHEGIFFFLILTAAVLAFSRSQPARWLDVAGQVALVLLLLRHAQWTFQSVSYDIRYPATGSAAVAEFIAEHGLHERVLYGTGMGLVEVQPYFDRNIFRNYALGGRAYWEWSPRNPWPYSRWSAESRREMSAWFVRQLADQPTFIVCGAGLRDDELYAKMLLARPDYRRIAAFGGYTFWKTRPSWFLSFHVFQRVTPPLPNGKPHASAQHSAAR